MVIRGHKMEMKCSNCLFYREENIPDIDYRVGRCHLHPPVIAQDFNLGSPVDWMWSLRNSILPMVRANSFCATFRPQDQG